MARLVFTEETNLESFKSQAETALGGSIEIKKNFSDNLHEIRDMKANSLWLVSDPALMRGFDYSCKSGIALLIAAPLPSRRDYRQALGRCQRYQQSADKRFLLDSLPETVDEAQAGALMSRAMQSKYTNAKFEPVMNPLYAPKGRKAGE